MAIEIRSTDGDAYLKGNKFLDYGSFKLSDYDIGASRLSYIVDTCRNKSILHIGFCDHQPLLKERIATGMWLHEHLVKVGKRCCGIDIDEAAVANVIAQTSIADVYAADVTRPGVAAILEQKWDIVVFPDVIEHIPNPDEFLRSFVTHYGRYVDEVMISVPNSQRLGSLKGVIFDQEKINSDHRAEYTVYTLAKLAKNAGLSDLRFAFTPYTKVSYLKRLLLNRFPRFSDSLLLTAKVGG